MARLRLLGGASLERDDGTPLTGRAGQRHRLALLALLACSPAGSGLSRDKLLALLWPESDTERARNLLNVSVYVIRQALGEDALLSIGDELRLNAKAVGADVVEFEAALARGDPEAAVALYRGPLLEGFFVADAPEFERWTDRERERLAGANARALEALAEGAEQRRDFRAATEWWRRRAAHDPYDSRVALRLMQALDVSGNRAGALQHASVHQRLLQEELGARPAPEVLALAERLRTAPVARVEPSREQAVTAVGIVAPPAPREAALDQPPAPPLAAAPALSPDPPASAEPAPVAPPTPAGAPPAPRRRHPALRYGVAALSLGVLLFGAIRWGPARAGTAPAAAARERSIAVLPLANLSADPGDAALADGMSEELIAMLARTGGLRVIASTSVSGFRDRKLDVRKIADSLGVANILEGGLQKDGSRLRVRVRLVDAHDGATRWSETYDRELRDVFAVQDDIARAVARELGVRLGGAPGQSLRRRHTQNLAAYELYLRGSDRALLRSDSAARAGLEYFRQALALDSTYAAAWAGLARMYGRVGTPGISRRERLILADQAARKALALDDSLAEGHATLGALRMASFDFAAAERHLARAIELDPTQALTSEWMVALHLWTERPAEALAYAERALLLDPLSPTAHAEVAHALLHNDRCDEALAHLEKLAGLRPPLLRAAPIAAQCYARKQMWPEAIAVLRSRPEADSPRALGLLGYMLARAGQGEEALRIRAALIERQGDGHALGIALIHAGLGDLDQFFDWLDRSVAEGSFAGSSGSPGQLILLGPLFEDVRRDPRFARLRERLGIPKR